jgi:hypothetical protein
MSLFTLCYCSTEFKNRRNEPGMSMKTKDRSEKAAQESRNLIEDK